MSRGKDNKNPGIKRPFFPLPETTDIENYTCVKLSIPNNQDYRVSLLSVLNMLTQWFNWQRDETKKGKDVAEIWREVIENMAWENACCCDDKPQRQRILSDGSYEISYDDGETWIPAPPEIDPRESSIRFPPLPLEAGETTRCAQAENVASALEEQLQNQIDDINLGVTIVGLVAGILAIAAIYLSLGTLTPLVTALAGALFGAGSAALSAAFTSEVWDEFKCIVYCNTPDDGNYSSADIQAIKDEIGETFIGIVVTVLWSYMDMYGSVGVTNLGRIGTATGSGCDDCDCGDEWCKTFDFTAGTQGWTEEGGYTALHYSGQGWGAVEDLGTGNVAYSARSIGIYIDWGTLAHITSMHVEWELQNAVGFGYFLDDHMLYGFTNILENPQGIPLNVDTTGIGVLTDRANPDSLLARIVRVTIRGTGDNPFGIDDC